MAAQRKVAGALVGVAAATAVSAGVHLKRREAAGLAGGRRWADETWPLLPCNRSPAFAEQPSLRAEPLGSRLSAAEAVAAAANRQSNARSLTLFYRCLRAMHASCKFLECACMRPESHFRCTSRLVSWRALLGMPFPRFERLGSP